MPQPSIPHALSCCALLALAALGCESTVVVPSPTSPGDMDAGAEADSGGGEVGSPEVGGGEDVPEVEDEGAPEPEPEPDPQPEPEPEVPPAYEHFEMVVDTARGDQAAWATFIHVGEDEDGPWFHEVGYGDTAARRDFWPASTIKVYPVTAALMILAEEGFGLDATATFYHDAGGGWVEDISMTFREMIFETFTCSSNHTYTLLLRFAGLDWLGERFFTQDRGFEASALMRGYISDRPWRYGQSEPQRVVVQEGGRSFERSHTWGGTPWADQAGCTVYSSNGTGNCTTPSDMAEHMRRIMFHEHLPEADKFVVRQADLDWVRFGDEDAPVMNNKVACGGPGWSGVEAVMPQADFYHKGGRVEEYRLDIQYVEDRASDTRYIAMIATDDGADRPLGILSEAVARMAFTPDRYVHLDYLVDNVNPVVADLVVYSEVPGRLELWTKPYDLDPDDLDGWAPLPGAEAQVPAGISSHTLASDCLDRSEQIHIRGRLYFEGDPEWAESDLHFVIVDATRACP